VALVLERAAALNHPNVITLDMHGEYTPLTEQGGFATGIRVAGPGDLDEYNNRALYLPHWLLNAEEMLALCLDRSDQNAPNQASRFMHHVRELKSETLAAAGDAGVDALNTFTVDSPIPYSLQDLLERLREDNVEMVKGSTGRDKQGQYFDKLTRFINRLEIKIQDRRYGFLFQGPDETRDFGWLADQAVTWLGSSADTPGIKIIDFSEVPSDVLPIVTGVFARLLYSIQFWMAPEDRSPVTFVCDEAHLYLPVKEQSDVAHARALEAFERIAKEGRKYGVSLLVVSQRPSDVSRTILSQCNNFMVMRLTNDQDQNVVRRFVSDSLSGLTDVIPLLDVGEAVLLGDAMLLPTRVKLNKPSIHPSSGTRDFWTEWRTHAPTPDGIRKGVAALRAQVRVDDAAE
jgi:hypothetical protein